MDRPGISSSKGQLGQILDVMAEAVTVTEADGRLVSARKAGRAEAVLCGCPANPEEPLQAIDLALAQFRNGEPPDDIAMLAVQLLPGLASTERKPAEA